MVRGQTSFRGGNGVSILQGRREFPSLKENPCICNEHICVACCSPFFYDPLSWIIVCYVHVWINVHKRTR